MAAWVSVAIVLGLMIGSFLNVVIHRLPLMLEREWRSQSREMLELPAADDGEKLTLVTPRSRCPHCGHPISALENIPLLSYAVLGGKCRGCKAGISLRYPAVELLTGLLTGLVAWQFGFTLAAFGGMLFCWLLISMTFIDLDHQLLPDNLTLPLLWLGLLFSLGNVYVSPAVAIIGAACGYLSLWLVFQGFKLATGKEGMGYGDFKLFAALGAWLGWSMLPLVILLASGVGAVVGISMILFGDQKRSQPIPFGPFLAAAGLIAFLAGDPIVGWYLGLYR
ncbi:MAG: A24 family peptidase [Gammaproteobacteria bacterium]|nr:A24 family peptidase [Gammaproteobacteria bacterium]